MPWDVITDNDDEPLEASILAVHAAVLPTNEVLLFGGDEHSFARFTDFKQKGIPLKNCQLFNVAGNTLSNITQSPDTDLFCCGHAFLGDGRLIASGGTRDWPITFYEDDMPENPHDEMNHWDGESACWVYNHWQRRWVRVRDLAFEPMADDPDYQEGGGRWYPTLITLPSGAVIAFGGHPGEQHTEHEHNTPEIYSAGKDEWEIHFDRILVFRYRYYPRGHLLRDGRIFFASPEQGGDSGIYDPATGDFEPLAPLPAEKAGLRTEHHFTTVLLPLLPQDNYRVRVLATGWSDQAIRMTVEEGNWEEAGARDWGGGTPPARRNGCAVLLPTGQVVLVGGVEPGGENNDQELDANAVLRAEVYTPGIDWADGMYTAGESWETDAESDAAQVPRNYHSVALLLADGRVLTAGSNFNASTGHPDDWAEKRIEVYRPWYFDDNDRPEITDSPSSITYGQRFTISTEQAESIERVALTRLGSVTHAFDADQRYVGLQIESRDGDSLTVVAPPDGGVAPPGYYMLWVVNEDGLPCVQAPFLQVGHQRVFIVMNKSSVSVHEVDSKLLSGEAVFSAAVYVILDGFAPDDYVAPTLNLTLDLLTGDPASDAGITASLVEVEYDISQEEGDTAQRIVHTYDLHFEDAEVFSTFDEMRTVHLRAVSGGYEGRAALMLHQQPNPYTIDGDEFWLSTDLRVFKAVEGLNFPPIPFTPLFPQDGDPLDYLSVLLESFNGWDPDDGTHPFEFISEDQESSKLELSRSVWSGNWPIIGTRRVYNFAIARVRYRSIETPAEDVRMFFRLFNTVGTALEYDTQTTYRRDGDGPDAAPLIGRDGKVILSIPYFAGPRVDTTEVSMTTQDDPLNVRTLQPTGAEESETYFGCWLDFNQTEPRYVLYPTTDGPFDGELRSLQQLSRGYHQCLVAEIHFGDDLIPPRATPGSSDKLTQRNLWIEETPNPGVSPDSRVVLTTCELQSTRMMLSPSAVSQLDELMIRWNNLPRNSKVTLFIPSVEASQVVEAAAERRGSPGLRRRDAHTLELVLGDVTFVPIPRLPSRTIPALLRVELPEGIKKGQRFRVQVHQFTDFGRPRGAGREIIASFQLDIAVRTGEEVLPGLIRQYSVLRHVAETIPTDDRWYPIFKVYLSETADRIRGLGFDPTIIEPSPDGTGLRPHREPPDDEPGDDEECDLLSGTGVTGKVLHIIYDCYGDFAGFTLDTCPGTRTFLSRERPVERLIREAFEKRWRLTVVPHKSDECHIKRIEVS